VHCVFSLFVVIGRLIPKKYRLAFLMQCILHKVVAVRTWGVQATASEIKTNNCRRLPLIIQEKVNTCQQMGALCPLSQRAARVVQYSTSKNYVPAAEYSSWYKRIHRSFVAHSFSRSFIISSNKASTVYNLEQNKLRLTKLKQHT